MAPAEIQELRQRIERLERKNRLLLVACLAVPVLTLVGWQTAGPTSLRVSKLEVVNEQGVPLVVLGPDRGGAGGSVVLRGADGERRGWFTASREGAALTLNREGRGGEGDTTLGLSVNVDGGRMSILSRKGASLSASIRQDAPKVELYNPKGATLFVAPWRNP